MNNSISTTDTIRNLTLYLLSLLMPTVMLPQLFADTIGLPKFILLMLGVAALLFLWGISIYKADLSWKPTPFDLPLFLLAIAYLLSTIFSETNTIVELSAPNGAGMIILLCAAYYLIVQLSKTNPLKVSRLITTGLVHAGLLISLWTIINTVIQITNLKFQIANFQFPLVNLSPLGNMFFQTIFLAIISFYIGLHALTIIKRKKQTEASPSSPIVIIGTFTFLLLGLIISLYRAVQLDPFPLLPYRAGWSIALDSFKNTPIFGIGPSNFVAAFTRFKPVFLNNEKLWNVVFFLSSNVYLHLLTTVGLFGFSAYLFLIYRFFCLNKKQRPQIIVALQKTIMTIFILQLLVPFNPPLLFTEFALLAALGAAISLPATSFRLVTREEGFIAIDNAKEQIMEAWQETQEKEYYES